MVHEGKRRMTSDLSGPQSALAADVEARLELARQAIRKGDLQALHDLRNRAGTSDPLAIELAYLLTLVIDVWRHPGRLPTLEAFASSERALARAGRDLIGLLQLHAFGQRDPGYIGGNCHQPRPADSQ